MTTKRMHIPTARKAGEMAVGADGRYDGFKDSDVVYIGRTWTMGGYSLKGSDWRNPYSVKKYGREEAVRLYREKILSDPEFVRRSPSAA